MLRSAHHHIFGAKQGRPRRGTRSCACYAALGGLLGVASACLNPDISDEAPTSVEVDSLADTDTTNDDAAEDDASEDDAAEDEPAEAALPEVSPPAPENRPRPPRPATRR